MRDSRAAFRLALTVPGLVPDKSVRGQPRRRCSWFRLSDRGMLRDPVAVAAQTRWRCPFGQRTRRWVAMWVALFVCANTSALLAEPVNPVVNLDLLTATPTVDVGDMVEIRLLARAIGNEDVTIVAVQSLLNWDSDVLRLSGVIDNVAPEYEWFLSGFFNDIGLDNLNDGVTTPPFGLPFNDGDASFEALGQFPPNAFPVATPAGTQITTFVFEALRASSPTKISIPLAAGEVTTSAVFWGEGAPGVDILGGTSNVFITVTPEPSTLVLFVLALAGITRVRTWHDRRAA